MQNSIAGTKIKLHHSKLALWLVLIPRKRRGERNYIVLLRIGFTSAQNVANGTMQTPNDWGTHLQAAQPHTQKPKLGGKTIQSLKR